jgi:hypothetical protein
MTGGLPFLYQLERDLAHGLAAGDFVLARHTSEDEATIVSRLIDDYRPEGHCSIPVKHLTLVRPHRPTDETSTAAFIRCKVCNVPTCIEFARLDGWATRNDQWHCEHCLEMVPA